MQLMAKPLLFLAVELQHVTQLVVVVARTTWHPLHQVGQVVEEALVMDLVDPALAVKVTPEVQALLATQQTRIIG
jgi:hypothetical protein